MLTVHRMFAIFTRKFIHFTIITFLINLNLVFQLSGQPLFTCNTNNVAGFQNGKFQGNKISNLAAMNISEIAFLQRRIEENILKGEAIIQIPVVVHVIHNDLSSNPNPNQSSHISLDQVFSQIRILNEDFRKKINSHGFNNNPFGADIGIEFCLASTDQNGNVSNGVNYIYNNRLAWNTSIEDESELKALSYWPSDKYLNIWVTNLEVEKGFGYARYPVGSGLADFEPDSDYGSELDGIVIDYRVFGTIGSAVYPYNLGRTTTHEVGHWLGLRHIWGDELCGNDFVDDTPMDQAPNDDLDCRDSSFCSNNYVQDQTNNYMDFSPDQCMNLFTQGQKERMLASLVSSPRRRSLFESQGCSNFSKKLYVNTYPNPTSDLLYIELYWPGHQFIHVEFYNSQGSTMVEMELENEKAFTFPLDVSTWSSGFYILKINTKGNNDSESKKFVKIIVDH